MKWGQAQGVSAEPPISCTTGVVFRNDARTCLEPAADLGTGGGREARCCGHELHGLRGKSGRVKGLSASIGRTLWGAYTGGLEYSLRWYCAHLIADSMVCTCA
jgi:hypothetical protein